MIETDTFGNIVVAYGIEEIYYEMEGETHDILLTANQVKQFIEKLQEAYEINGNNDHLIHLIFFIEEEKQSMKDFYIEISRMDKYK